MEGQSHVRTVSLSHSLGQLGRLLIDLTELRGAGERDGRSVDIDPAVSLEPLDVPRRGLSRMVRQKHYLVERPRGYSLRDWSNSCFRDTVGGPQIGVADPCD